MTIAIEQILNADGANLEGNDFPMYVPDIDGDIYVFFHCYSNTSTPHTYLNIKWNASEITGLAIYQENEDLTVHGKSNHSTNTGYFLIPEADKGTVKNFQVDGSQSTTSDRFIAVMVSGIGSITDVDVNNQETDMPNPATHTDTSALGLEEMLLAFHLWKGTTGTLTVNDGTLLSYRAWAAFSEKSYVLIDYAKGAGKTGTITTDSDVDDAEDLFSSCWKLSPDWTLGVRPWMIVTECNNATTDTIALPSICDQLIYIRADGRGSTYTTTPNFNSDDMTLIGKAGYVNNASVDNLVEAWYLDNPDTGASYTHTRSAGGSTYDRHGLIGIVNGGEITKVDTHEVDASTMTEPVITADGGDLVFAVIADYGDGDIDENSNQFHDDEDYVSHNWIWGADSKMLNTNGNCFVVGRGETGSMTPNFSVAGGSLDKSCIIFAIDAGPGGGSAPMPVMLGAMF